MLIQIVLALGAFHLRFHARLNLLFDLQNAHFALHQAVNFLKTLADGQRFKQLLLLMHFNAEMAGHEIRELRRIFRFHDRGERLFGHVFLNLGVALELLRDSTHKCFNRSRVTRHFRQILCSRLKEAVVLKVFRYTYTCLALNENLYRAIGKFQQLQHVGDYTGIENTIDLRIIFAWITLRGEQDLFVIRHHLFQGAD